MKVWSIIFGVLAVAAMFCCIISAVWVPVTLMMAGMGTGDSHDGRDVGGVMV